MPTHERLARGVRKGLEAERGRGRARVQTFLDTVVFRTYPAAKVVLSLEPSRGDEDGGGLRSRVHGVPEEVAALVERRLRTRYLCEVVLLAAGRAPSTFTRV